MRIIGGKYKSRRLPIPSTFKARPTTDMAKENLFNILNNYIDWEETNALDLFAGTGSMGLEMLSRGAQSVLAVEKNPAHYRFIKEVSEKLGDDAYKVINMDALRWIEMQRNKNSQERAIFKLIFADPPYSFAGLKNIYDLVLESGILSPSGLLIIEHPKEIDFSDRPYFTQLRHYGAVHFSFFDMNEK